MTSSLREFLFQRAGNRCEYCRTPVLAGSLWGAHIEHIKPRQHGGTDNQNNLAVSCAPCNFVKGPNIAAVDPATNNLVRLFNPRRDGWTEHFKVRRGAIVGLTPIGRATVALLAFNHPLLVKRRQRLHRMGVRFNA
jgi:hypothetical protein